MSKSYRIFTHNSLESLYRIEQRENISLMSDRSVGDGVQRKMVRLVAAARKDSW